MKRDRDSAEGAQEKNAENSREEGRRFVFNKRGLQRHSGASARETNFSGVGGKNVRGATSKKKAGGGLNYLAPTCRRWGAERGKSV